MIPDLIPSAKHFSSDFLSAMMLSAVVDAGSFSFTEGTEFDAEAINSAFVGWIRGQASRNIRIGSSSVARYLS
jgi:hypothetical protein